MKGTDVGDVPSTEGASVVATGARVVVVTAEVEDVVDEVPVVLGLLDDVTAVVDVLGTDSGGPDVVGSDTALCEAGCAPCSTVPVEQLAATRANATASERAARDLDDPEGGRRYDSTEIGFGRDSPGVLSLDMNFHLAACGDRPTRHCLLVGQRATQTRAGLGRPGSPRLQ